MKDNTTIKQLSTDITYCNDSHTGDKTGEFNLVRGAVIQCRDTRIETVEILKN